jgi:N utilization substance protein A
MNGDFIDALRQLEKEKDIPFEQLVETVETALTTAYRRRYTDGADVKLRMDARGRGLRAVLLKEVVESVENPHRELSLAEAQRRNPTARIGDFVDVEMPNADDFGRIAAQTAKQVVVQRIREAERERVFDEFGHRVGEVITGVVQRRESRGVYVLLGKVEALLPGSEQVHGEPYRFNDRLKVYLLEVRRTTRGPQVIISRSHPSLIRRLFELEVPEIEDGTVLIKSVAREAGHRSKIAVASTDEKVDPVGACVGHRGSRVQAVVNELYGEKIDIIRWHENPADFIREALSPARAVSVTINEETNSAYVVVPDAQLSLAIGKEGQNVRLAARLTGWRIDIRSETQDRDRQLDELAQRELDRQAGEHAAAGEAEE